MNWLLPFQVTFSKAFESLAVATIENVVQEKFSSKALRIFRFVAVKKIHLAHH